jgi:hypothetical protein
MAGRRKAWNDESIERELRAFLAGRPAWPPYREFQRAGLKSLRDAVTRTGGAKRWARKVGTRYVAHRPGYAPIWTDERIRMDLREYLAGRDEWPSREQFDADDQTALRNAVNRTGGPDRWAADFGLRRTTRLSGVRRGWTHQVVEAELKRLIGKQKMSPPQRAFEQAGLASMLRSINRHEGAAYWAGRLGVEQRAALGHAQPRYWTDERIRRELKRFCRGRDVWPTETEFIEAGKRLLYCAASRNGGVARWAAELGLARRGLRG